MWSPQSGRMLGRSPAHSSHPVALESPPSAHCRSWAACHWRSPSNYTRTRRAANPEPKWSIPGLACSSASTNFCHPQTGPDKPSEIRSLRILRCSTPRRIGLANYVDFGAYWFESANVPSVGWPTAVNSVSRWRSRGHTGFRDWLHKSLSQKWIQ